MANDAEYLEGLLADYVEGQLDAASAQIIEDHLAKNPATRAAVEQMKLDRSALRSLPRVNAPADLSEDLRGRLERDQLLNADPITSSPARRFSPSVAALAAMLMLGFGVAGIAYVLLSDRPKPYLATADDAPTTTAANEQLAVGGAPESQRMSAVRSLDQSTAGDAGKPMVTAAPRANVATMTAPGEIADRAAAKANAAEMSNADAAPASALPPPQLSQQTEPQRPPTEQEAEAKLSPQAAGGAASAIAREPSLNVSDEPLPPDAFSAIASSELDPSRRSIVVVVDSSHALDAFAFASRFAGKEERSLEVTDEGKKITSFSRNRIEDDASAKLAVVARGLDERAASAFQDELKRVDAEGAAAFEIRPVQPGVWASAAGAGPATTQSTAAARPAPTQPATPAAADHRESATTLPTTPPSLVTAGIQNGPALIHNGERLRVTLTDPDAFDLRTQHEVTVDPAGNVALPSLDAVRAAGKSSESLRSEIVNAYRDAKLMRRPIVKVESIDSGAESRDLNQLIDLYVVVRPSAPPASQPTTQPTTAPAQ